MNDEQTEGGTRSARRTARRRTTGRRRVVIAAGIVVALVVTVGVATAIKLNGNISRVDLDAGSTERPHDARDDINILVIGSDTRKGLDTDEYGTGTAGGGARSDTNLLVHISADRQSTQVVSIPRDSMTKAPTDCSDPSSTVGNGEIRRWNDNFNKGGPACVVKTLEGLTDIYIDHVAVIDFAGFQRMVDALGGVEVCLPKPVDDPDAQIQLPAGRQVLDGHDALGYVRMRKTLGDGSDLQRIERQQAFMSSMVQEATSTSLLLRPDRLYSFLDAATESMTADDDLTLSRMTSIATSLKEIGTDEIVFVTVPTEPYPENTNRVQWQEEKAEKLWTAIREDEPLPGSEAKSSSTSSGTSESSEPGLTVAPSEVTVSVVNDTWTGGLAAQEAEALSVQGFATVVADVAPTAQQEGVVVHHAPGDDASARTVAAAYPGADLEVDETLTKGIVRVVLGKGSEHATEVPNREGSQPIPEAEVEAPVPPDEVETRKASEDICS